MAKIRIPHMGHKLAWLIRGLCRTLDFQVTDLSGLYADSSGPVPSTIWAFWHNRLFIMPHLYEQCFIHRTRGMILTSPSGDGQIIADACAAFGLEAARGSSSKPQKGLSALMLMAEKIRQGYSVAVTPDGPRGPRYQLQGGLVKLAQLTGAAVVPVRIHYSTALRFPSWDQFMLPLPFSRVQITIGPLHNVPRRMTEAEFETTRLTIQATMLTAAET
jgi:Kdo2-lipid IVA 3' secondary acyltransferase